MHNDSEALTSAVAIAAGMGLGVDHNAVYDWAEQNGWGASDLYCEVGQLAALSAALASRIALCPEFVIGGFPGVYTYEVDELLGAAVREMMQGGVIKAGFAGPDSLLLDPVKLRLGELAADCFSRAGKPIPVALAIIREMTGYTRGAAS
jgi:hypothetical protein